MVVQGIRRHFQRRHRLPPPGPPVCPLRGDLCRARRLSTPVLSCPPCQLLEMPLGHPVLVDLEDADLVGKPRQMPSRLVRRLCTLAPPNLPYLRCILGCMHLSFRALLLTHLTPRLVLPAIQFRVGQLAPPLHLLSVPLNVGPWCLTLLLMSSGSQVRRRAVVENCQEALLRPPENLSATC